MKHAVTGIHGRLPCFRTLKALAGANDSSQYLATLGYASLLGPREETIRIEVGLREPLLTPALRGEARTLLLDPVSGSPAVDPFPLACLSSREAMAEKLRAALSRREAAIRDFYDVDHAIRNLGLNLRDPELSRLVREKLAVPGNPPADVSAARLDALRLQVESQLKPVLRARDFAEFDLERAFASVKSIFLSR